MGMLRILYCIVLYCIVLYCIVLCCVVLSEVGGSEFAFRQPPRNRKSFRFVRACAARFLDVKRIPSANVRRAVLPFSLLAGGAFPFSIWESCSLFPVRSSEFKWVLVSSSEF